LHLSDEREWNPDDGGDTQRSLGDLREHGEKSPSLLQIRTAARFSAGFEKFRHSKATNGPSF
jgi:hypothetical protein